MFALANCSLTAKIVVLAEAIAVEASRKASIEGWAKEKSLSKSALRMISFEGPWEIMV